MGAKIPGDLLAVEKQGGRVRMHFSVVTGVSSGYRAELARQVQKWGRRPRKWSLKEAPSWIFSQLSMTCTWIMHFADSPVQIDSPWSASSLPPG